MAKKPVSPPQGPPLAEPASAPEETLAVAAESAAPLEAVGGPPMGIFPDTPDFQADEDAFGATAEEWKWHLDRQLPKGKGWETCTSYPAGIGAVSADLIREEWGAGTYYARLRGPHGHVKKHRIFTLAAPRVSVLTHPTPAPAVDLAGVLREIAAENRRGLEQLAAALQARPAPANYDPSQMLDMAMRMAERMAPRERGNVLDQVAQWFGLAEKFRSGGKDWFDVLDKGIDTVKPLIDATVSHIGGVSAAANGAGAPAAGGAPASSQPQVEAPPMLQLANFLQRQVRFLVPKAIGHSSPSLYAELLLDNLPPKVDLPDMLARLKAPDALDRLFSMLPNDDRIAATGQRPWFEELLREIIEMLEASIGAAPAAGETAAAGESDTGEEKSDTPVA